MLYIGGMIAGSDDSGMAGILLFFGAVAGFFCILGVVFGYVLVMGLVLLIPGLGVRWAASSISQSRELLADATAAQMTRDPDALIRALGKVSAGPGRPSGAAAGLVPLMLRNPFWNLRQKGLNGLVAFLLVTHPPIEVRVAALRRMIPDAPAWRNGRR